MIKKLLILLTFAAIICVDAQPTNALALTLKRIVFEGPKRAEVLILINNSNKAETYRVGWRHYVMTPDKNFVPVSEDALPSSVRPSKDMIVFSPRRVTVEPRSSQKIRLMLRTPPGLADGEYRSHLWIRTEGDVEELKRQKAEREAITGKKGSIIAILPGVTLPVIVRKGALDATVDFTDFSATQTPGFIQGSYKLLRGGDRSVYGDIEYICNQGSSSAYILRQPSGYAVYTEVSYRNMDFKFERPQNTPSCQTLTLKFIESEESTRKEKAITTEKTFTVG